MLLILLPDWIRLILEMFRKPLHYIINFIFSSGSSSLVGGGGLIGAKNMKSMWPPLVAIFFMTYFYRAGGAWPSPPGSATGTNEPVSVSISSSDHMYM